MPENTKWDSYNATDSGQYTASETSKHSSKESAVCLKPNHISRHMSPAPTSC